MAQTNLPLFHFDNLFNNFAHEYRIWVFPNVEPEPPYGSAMADVADALGSTNNPDVMSNLERALNVSISLSELCCEGAALAIYSLLLEHELSI